MIYPTPAIPVLPDEVAGMVFTLPTEDESTTGVAPNAEMNDMVGHDQLIFLGRRALALLVAEHVVKKTPRARMGVLRVSFAMFPRDIQPKQLIPAQSLRKPGSFRLRTSRYGH